MTLNLDKKAISNMRHHKHITNGLTPLEIYVFNPFWNFLTDLLPEWITPN